MIRAFYSAVSGLKSGQNNVDIIANNLANSETTGYKSKKSEFESLLYTSMNNAGINAANSAKLEVGSGSATGTVTEDLTQGSVEETGRLLDYSIMGEGYFQVEDGAGNRYFTRDGAFEAQNTGGTLYLADSDGRLVLDGNSNPITLGADGASSVEPGVFSFADIEGLKSDGSSLYTQTAASGVPVKSATQVKQRSLESSNVNMIEQMTGLVMTERNFQLGSKVVETADNIENLANQLR